MNPCQLDTMKTNTFEHLENLCRAKGIVCERYSRNRITLTTPSGGTEAECKTVTEALDCIRHDETFCNLPVILRAPATAETNAQSIRTMRKAIAATFPAIMDDTEAAREGYTKNNAPEFDPPNRFRMFSVVKKMDNNGNSVLLIRDLRHGNRKRFQIDPAQPGSKSGHEHGRDYLRSIGISCDAIGLGNKDSETVLLSSDFATQLI